MENKEKEMVEFPCPEIVYLLKGSLLPIFIGTFSNQILLASNLFLLSIIAFH